MRGTCWPRLCRVWPVISYVGFTGLKGNFARTHASVATAAVAFAEAGGDLVGGINRLLGVSPGKPLPPMKLVTLEAGLPCLPVDAGLIVAGDFETYRMRFFAPIHWTSGEPVWWPVGSLAPHFTLNDVESVESNVALTSPVPRRRPIRLLVSP